MSKNRLKDQQSPYLLQHADNPVHWYPWNDEAFADARKMDKPVFLSIGYATCHWCHVMAHESFEDEETARILNETFICIKVDREERPDIDNLYMQVSQIISGSGGWPLTILLTPDKRPFFAATYIPRDTRQGRVGLKELSSQVAELWSSNPERIEKSAGEITDALIQYQDTVRPDDVNPTIGDRAYVTYEQSYDSINGGFGKGQRFPTPANLMFLMRHSLTGTKDQAASMALHTIKKICLGGIHDHVAGGFHRYTIDENWHTPHFEKMLYDQAMMVKALTEAWQLTGNPLFKTSIERCVTFLLSELRDSSGMFYSALDADSDGEEGKYYTWSWDELSSILSSEQLQLAADYYNLNESGNFKDEATGESTGLNILHAVESVEKYAADNSMEPDVLYDRLDKIRTLLAVARKNRVRPFLDDKILTDWNGLMISALAEAGAATGNSEFITIAIETAEAILDANTSPDGTVMHSCRNSITGTFSSLPDYASLCRSMITLHQVTGTVAWLEKAVLFYRNMKEKFHDKTTGAWFLTPEGADITIVRQKDFYDGAQPSGNSLAADCALLLSRITADPTYEQDYDSTCEAFGGYVNQYPTAYAWFLTTWQHAGGKSREIVIIEENGTDAYKAVTRSRYSSFDPFTVLLSINKSNKHKLDKLAPFTRTYTTEEGSPAAYLCRNKTCMPAVSGIKAIAGIIEDRE
jgi:uncharacterized protein YyaL (SSP411 family)